MTHSTGSSDRGARTDLVVALLLATAVVARVIWLLAVDVRTLTFRTTDDSYYYFQTALNLTHGRGWTFDGMHPTNGFHPLWMAMLLPVFALWGDDHVLALRMAGVLIALVAGATAWVGWRAFEALAGRRAAVIGLLLLAQPFALYPIVNGLETGILIFSLLLLLWMARRHDLLALDAGPRRDIALGALLGLTFLARLDSVFLVPVLVAALLAIAIAARGRAGAWVLALRKLLVVGTTFAAVGTPYLIWNLAMFGHLVPISGALKSTFPVSSFDPGRLRSFHTLYGIGQMAISTLGLAILAWRARRGGIRVPHPGDGGGLGLCAVLLGANAIHLVYSILFVAYGANWWHHASYLPVTLALSVMVFAALDDGLGRRAWVMAGGMALAVALMVAGFAIEGRQRGEARAHWYDAAMWARAHLPPGAVLAMTDCGFVGYFGGHPMVNLDGVINGYVFQEALRDGRLSEYLAAAKVAYIGGHLARYLDGQERIRLPARLFHRQGGAIIATPEAEVYRSEPFLDGSAPRSYGPVRFVFWDIRRVRIVDDVRMPIPAGAPPP